MKKESAVETFSKFTGFLMLIKHCLLPGLLLVVSVLGAEAKEVNFGYGYIPADPKTFSEQPTVPRYRAFLPVSVDLSRHFPTPGMQDAESCSGWAVGYAARSYYASTLEKRNIREANNVPSPAFIYNAIRDPGNCNSGSMLLDAFLLLKEGSLSTKDFPANSGCRLPSADERRRAKDFKIGRWLAVDPKRLDDVKGQLALGHPVIFGADVGPAFERLRGTTIYRGETGDVSGHAMTVVGYDDTRQAFKIINSWGALWGNRGFGWIDYGTFRSISREAYIIEVEKPKPLSDEVAIAVPEIEIHQPPSSSVAPPNPTIKLIAPEPELDDAGISTPLIDRPVTNSDCSYVYSDASLGSRRLTGFVGSDDDLARLRQLWSGQIEEFDVQVRPWPQCEVLLTLASALDEAQRPHLATASGKHLFKEGEEMAFKLVTPSAPAYIYVAFIQADGSVITLMQPQTDMAPATSNQTIMFGDGKDGSARFSAAPPFGTEMVLAVSSPSPLFDDWLPEIQTEREFLSSLRRALLYKSDPAKGDRRVAATFLGIKTEAKK